MSALKDVRDNRYKKSLKKVTFSVDTHGYFTYLYIIKLKERDMVKVANAVVVAMGTVAIAGLMFIVGSVAVGEFDFKKVDSIVLVGE